MSAKPVSRAATSVLEQVPIVSHLDSLHFTNLQVATRQPCTRSSKSGSSEADLDSQSRPSQKSYSKVDAKQAIVSGWRPKHCHKVFCCSTQAVPLGSLKDILVVIHSAMWVSMRSKEFRSDSMQT
eukprot:15466463-Alexandrium_andersonii.AAC.1